MARQAKTILVVEDEPLIADAVAARLRSEGYEVARRRRRTVAASPAARRSSPTSSCST